MSLNHSTLIIVKSRNELKDELRRVRRAYTKELNVNGLTGKLEEIEKRKDALKSQLSRGIYV